MCIKVTPAGASWDRPTRIEELLLLKTIALLALLLGSLLAPPAWGQEDSVMPPSEQTASDGDEAGGWKDGAESADESAAEVSSEFADEDGSDDGAETESDGGEDAAGDSAFGQEEEEEAEDTSPEDSKPPAPVAVASAPASTPPTSAPTAGSALQSGTVKWFDNAKGHGVITTERGQDVFVHFSSIQGGGFRSLPEGTEVEFRVNQGPKEHRRSTSCLGEVSPSGPVKASGQCPDPRQRGN